MWPILLGAVGIVVVLVTLFCVLPEPSRKGYVLDLEIKNCRTTNDAKEEIISYWNKRIASVSWEDPRAGWLEQMTEALRADPGIIVDALVVKQNEIKIHQKPWNKGKIQFVGWREVNEITPYYFPNETCNNFLAGSQFQYFNETAAIETPTEWPPEEVQRFVPYSKLKPVPEDYLKLAHSLDRSE